MMGRDTFESKHGSTIVCAHCDEDAVYAERIRAVWLCEDCLAEFISVPLPDRDQWLRDIGEKEMASWSEPQEYVALNRFQAREPISGFEKLIDEVGKYLEAVEAFRSCDLEPRWTGEH